MSDRRSEIIADIIARTGIDEAMIERLVRTFYGKIRKDPLLGPVFETRIADWEPHLKRMCAFWSSVALTSGVYSGRPMEKHLPLPVDARHFDRWLALFNDTAREVCPSGRRGALHRARASRSEKPGARHRGSASGAADEGRAAAAAGRRRVSPPRMTWSARRK